MARRKKARRNAATPGWVWMLFGLGLGLLVAVGVYLRILPNSTAEPLAEAPKAASAPVPAVATPSAPRAAPAEQRSAPRPPTRTAEPAENRFDFYEVLPQFEVDVSSSPGGRGTSAPVLRSRPVEEPGRYLLQAGSFSAAVDADRLQANLALLGIESRVQRVTIDGTVFHRVQVGPTTDLDALNRTRSQLRDAGIDALVRKARD
jgi:cell division protein FtsN